MKSGALTSVKLMRLKRALGLTQYQAVGLLECLWHFTAHNTPDGGIGKYTDDDIAAVLEWEGAATELIEALIQSGWLDRHDNGSLWIHDWLEHCPTWVRGVAANKIAREKNGLCTKSPTKYLTKSDTESTTKSPTKSPTKYPTKYPTKLHTSVATTLPYLNLPNQEEIHLSGAQLTDRPLPENPIEEILKAPLANGTTWEISAAQIEFLTRSFPGADVQSQILGAVAWLEANPKKRKTAKGMPRFLTSWLLRTVSRSAKAPPRNDLSKIGSDVEFEEIGASVPFLERLSDLGNEVAK
jgi:hypothetical protein